WGGVGIAALLGAARLDAVDVVLPPVVDDDAPPGGDDVAIPVHLVAIRELGHESLRHFRENERCFVGTARFAADMADQREGPGTASRQPRCQPVQGVLQHPEEPLAEGVTGHPRRSPALPCRSAAVPRACRPPRRTPSTGRASRYRRWASGWPTAARAWTARPRRRPGSGTRTRGGGTTASQTATSASAGTTSVIWGSRKRWTG